MTGILKQLSAKSIANVATDNYEVEAAKILHLNDQIDRATQALNIVCEYDRKFDSGWKPTTQFDRNAYQQSMESASALTYDFMPLDIGYSVESSEKKPGLLKRLWEWIKAAVGNLMKMIREMLGMRKTKLIKVSSDFEQMLAAIGRIAKDKPDPFKDGKEPDAHFVINTDGSFVGVGSIRTALDACAKVNGVIANNVEKLVNFDPTSVTPVKNKIETGGKIRDKINLPYQFDLFAGMKLVINIKGAVTEGRSGVKTRRYTGPVLAVSVMKDACTTSLSALKELKDGEAGTYRSIIKFDQRIEAIRKKNYESLGNRHYDAMKQRMEGHRLGPRPDYDQLEQDANVFNALTEMISSHYRAIGEVYYAGLTYVEALKYFIKANLQQYRELAE